MRSSKTGRKTSSIYSANILYFNFFIFEEKLPNYASGPKSAPKSDSFWIRQFCLLTYTPRSKWASSEKMIFLAKIDIFCKSIASPLPSVVLAYTQPYSFGGNIKLIICQIRHELTVTIHEISTTWKKTLNGGPYINTTIFLSTLYYGRYRFHFFPFQL